MNKQHILDEIKRTAETNGGVALGKGRFFNETGIKESDWKGKLWIRWSDAVKEAGLTAQQMTTAYDEQMLIEKFIAFIRELGHFPVIPELRIKSRNDKNFPSDSTFSSRLGSKQQIAKCIAQYCNQNEGYDDVLALCEPILEQSQVSEDEIGNPDDVAIGFVYMIKRGRYYKIGHTNSVGRRDYELGLKQAEKTRIIHEIKTDDPRGIEAYWHKRFETKCMNNSEWFDLTSADVSAFKRRKFFM